MKVLIVSSCYHPYYKGGGEYSAKQLAEGLLAKGLEVVVLTAFRKYEEEEINGVKVIRIKHPNIYWSYDRNNQSLFRKILWHLIECYNPTVKKVAQLIKRDICPDVVHFRNIEDFSPVIFKYLSQMGIPTIQTLNSYSMIDFKASLYRESTFGTALMRLTNTFFFGKKIYSSYATAVVGVSKFTLNEHVRRGYYKNSIKEVIRTSIPINSSLDYSENDGEPLVFGYIGRIDKTKGVHVLINAFNKVKGDAKLIIAGDGDQNYLHFCKSLVVDKRVEFKGQIEKSYFYSNVDIVVIPSLWHEPFPRVAVEALGYGLPIIVSSNGGSSEVVEEGVNGFVFSNNNELEQCLEKFTDRIMLESTKKMTILSVQAKTEDSDISSYIKLYKRLFRKTE